MNLESTLFLAALVVAFGSGLAFRRGQPERWSRRMARNYRNPAFGRAMSTLPLIVPVGAVLFSPLILPVWAVVTGHLPDWPHWARSLSAWGFASYMAFSMGALLLIAVRRPAWLVPRWLREDEARENWVPPQVGFVDRVLAVLGVGFILGGVGFIVAALAGASGTRGL